MLHSNKAKQLVLQNGDYVKSRKLPIQKHDVMAFPKVQEQLKSEFKHYNENIGHLEGINLELDVTQWEPELVYYKSEQGYILAYFVSVYPNLGEHYEYIVDAASGKVIEKYSTICDFHGHEDDAHGHSHCNHHKPGDKKPKAVMNGPVPAAGQDLLGVNRNFSAYEFNNDYFMIDASRTMFNGLESQMPDDPVGVIWTIDMDNTSPVSGGMYQHIGNTVNSWTQTPTGVSAHFNAGRAYDYFKNVHGRESISGSGQNILSFVNVANEDGTSLGNAFWNGLGIYYGNGDNQFLPLGRGIDVAGHEMTHGVVQSTADLQYFGESGAINESMADVFGTMIDRDDWLIGEDVLRNGGALRNMADPHNGAQNGDFVNGWQPKHYSERYTGNQDNGGVHINSGIPNHAFFLFANEVGIEIAEKVYYRALTTYLTRSSQFKDLRFAVAQAASDLYSADVVSVARAAFDQVGVTDESQGNYEQEYEVNPGDDLLLYADPDLSNSFIINLTQANRVFNPLSETDILSKPSIKINTARK